MPATISKTSIVNRALQHLGVSQVASITENSSGAKAMLRAYDSVLLAQLEANTWRFAIKRANLAADATAPIHGKAKYYNLPGDFLYLAPEETTLTNPPRRDWEIEGNQIVTDDDAPLPIRYVSSNIVESMFSATFAEAFAIALAIATCEELTNSNTKLSGLMSIYVAQIQLAKKRNAIQGPPRRAPTVSWLTTRL